MRIECASGAVLRGLLSILLATLIMLPLLVSAVIAKPLQPNPETKWPGGTIWGTVLHMENNENFIGEAWFGARTGPEYKGQFVPPPGDYIYPLFPIGGSAYDTDVKADVAAPQHFSWYVELRRSGSGAPENATISSVMENADDWFVPQEYSVVLDNSAQGIFVNLRNPSSLGSDNFITGLTKYATLYVDNAVDITISPSYLAGNVGDNLTYTVTVKNTGKKYLDTYVLENSDSRGWALKLDSKSFSLAQGENKQITLTVTVGENKADTVRVVARGALAQDDYSVIAAGPAPGVKVSISPENQDGLRNGTLTYDVTVTNTGIAFDNFKLTVGDNSGWGPTLSENFLENVENGENRTVTLAVTIPNNAQYGAWDNITVTAISQVDNTVDNENSCMARALQPEGNPGVSISPENQIGLRKGTLTYTVTITNPTTFAPAIYMLKSQDNLSWSLSIDNEVTVPENSSENFTLTVTIPDNAQYDVWDNITLKATSKGDNTFENSDNCMARALQPEGNPGVSISPQNQSGLRKGTLTYTVTITNPTTFAPDTYTLTAEDNAGWIIWATIYPSDDSYVDNSSGNKNKNYGNETTLLAGNENISYLKWRLPPTPGGIISAKIWMYEGNALGVHWGNVNVCRVENDNWSENGITWNNQPGFGSIEDSVSVRTINSWYSWNVASWVDNQSKVDNIVSVAFNRQDNWGPTGFYSRETVKKPYLEIVYKRVGAPLPTVPLGSFTVPENSSENVTLTVTIPDNAQYDNWDNITVTATSQADNKFENSDNCGALALQPEGNPGVSISPENQDGLRKGTLTYTVTITNPTTFAPDTYTLTAEDDLHWSLSIENGIQPEPWAERGPWVTVPENSSENVTLTVTILDNASYDNNNVWDNITVKAISQADNNFDNWDNCMARALPPQFQFSILPGENRGALGETLNYQVIIKNTSAGPDTYTINKAGTRNWLLALENTVTIPSGENRTLTLGITIPDNASLGTWDNITITVTSQADNRYENSASCVAWAAISVLPHSQIGPIGTRLAYTVTFCNTSESVDNYALVTTDSSGWNMWFKENLFVNVSSGENRTTTLTVLLCGSTDVISVTAASTYASASATVMAGIPIPDIIVHGSYTAVNIENTDGLPWVWYGPSQAYQYPPIMVAQRVGAGGVVTGDASTCRNGRWISGQLDVLLDNAFQWMKPGATKVLWCDQTIYVVYNTTSRCSDLIAALENKTLHPIGYTVTSMTQRITPDSLAGYDILVVPQFELGGAYTGGNPSLLPDADVAAIKSFVEGGGGLLIMEGADSTAQSGNNYYKVQNKILNALDVAMGFQSDGVNDPLGVFTIQAKVDNTTWIGSAYENATGKENVTLYTPCSMAPLAPAGIFVNIVPEENRGLSGDNVDFLVTLVNTLDEDNYILTVADNRWPLKFDNKFDIKQNKGVVTTLRVAIPGGTAPRTGDLVTVTVTSQSHPIVKVIDNPIIPTDDSYVQENATIPLPGHNYNMYVGYDTIDNSKTEWAYVKFDNLNLIPSGAVITSATLNLCTRYGPANPSDTDMYVEAFAVAGGVDNDNWNENTITWANRPNGPSGYTGALLDNVLIPGGTEIENLWYSWNVTPLVQSDYAGDKQVSIMLRSIESDTNRLDNHTIWFYTKDNNNVSQENYKPYLKVNYGLPIIENASCTAWAALPYDVDVNVSPEENFGVPGENVGFTLNVKNLGKYTDNYNLTVENSKNWAWSLPSSVGPIASSENIDIPLKVSVPTNAQLFDNDVLTITATSKENSAVKDSASCRVRVTLENWGVRVEILPKENRGIPGENVGFTVTVTNIGKYADNYDLLITDNAHWFPRIAPTRVSLAALGENTAKLTVTIPLTAEPLAGDNIRVTARSTHLTLGDNDTCIARATGENILISISPEENSGAPGENVTFIVTVKNIGGATDNYALENSDNSGWALNIDNTLLTVPAGENRMAILTVSIPNNAENGTRDNVVVKATSRTDNKFNSASCIATVAGISGLGVQVSISPEENSAPPGVTLAFTATVKNTGNVEDTYVLTVKDDAGWGASLDENMLTILENETTTVTVSVTVPSDAIEGDTTQITVTAISQSDSTVENSASCIAEAEASAPIGPSGLPKLPLLIAGVVATAAIVVIAIAVLLKKGVISL